MDSNLTALASTLKPNWPLLAGLRFVLAVWAFGDHLRFVGGPSHLSDLAGAQVAVGMFFLISGFSIAYSLEREPTHFYERRFYRIWPVYFVATLIAMLPFVMGNGIYTWPTMAGWAEAPGTFKLVANLLLLHPLLADTIRTNIAAWSLGVEAAFYLLAPWYGRLSDPARLRVLFASMGLITASHLFSLNILGNSHIGVYVGGWWVWSLGFELSRRRTDPGFKLKAAFILACMAPMTFFSGVFAGITVCPVAWLILNQDSVKLTNVQAAALLYLGELSYELYILHDPVMATLNQAWPTAPWPVYCVALAVVSTAVYHGIDKPVRSWNRRRLGQKKTTAGPAALEPAAI